MNIRLTVGRCVATAWRAGVLALALLSALTLPGPANADVVTDWNVIAEAVAPLFGGPPIPSRVRAIAQIAVHDALNAIEPRYERYTGPTRAHHDASPDAAVAAAAGQTLLELLAPLPDSAAKLAAIDRIETAYAATVGPEPYDAATQAGIDAGAAAAKAILALREDDGSAMPHLPYTPDPAPGVYQPTPNPEFPAVIMPSFAGWAHVTPFALRHNTQFKVKPGAIFDLTGAAYAREYNEVKQVGDARVRGALPDSEESDIARFWYSGGVNLNQTAREIANGRGLDSWQQARLFALLNMAGADTAIAIMTWKYTYNFWRPVTAIRWADDGNPDTVSDPSWRPFLVTPPYPDYPCGLPAAVGATTEVLRQFFDSDDIASSGTVNAPAVPLPDSPDPLPAKTITRSFDSLSAAAAESQDARVYAGIHFREGCEAGVRHGTRIARFVVRHELQPLKGK